MQRKCIFLLWAAVCVSLNTYAVAPSGNYKDIVDQISALQASYPKVSALFSIGQNDDGVDIMAMRISTSPAVMDPKKIGQLLVAVHHGNEGTSANLAISVAKKLLAKYSSAELFRGNIADTEWTIVPVLNISGFNAGQRYEHNIDPNRDYPGPCTSDPGGKLASIRAMMRLLTTRIYTGSITVHGYAYAMTFPWGISVDDTHTLDYNAYEQITAKAAQFNGYKYGTSTDIVYPCDGAYEDYVYWKYGIWSLLIELATGSDSDIESTSLAAMSFYDQLDSSPSTKNQMTGKCMRSKPFDLHFE